MAAAQRPAPIVVVTGLADRSSVRRVLQESLAAAGAEAHVVELDPRCRPVGLPDAVDVAVLTSLGDDAHPRWVEASFAPARRARRAVLDADDGPSRGAGSRLAASVTWTSRDPRNPLLLDHLDRGGEACLFEDGALRLCAGRTRETAARAAELPALLGGAARRPVAAALAGLGACVALGLSLEAARAGLGRLSGPRYARRAGVQVLLERAADREAIEEGLRTLGELPAERRLVWRALGRLDAEADALARAGGVRVMGESGLEALLAETRPGDALLVLVPQADLVAERALDRFERGGER